MSQNFRMTVVQKFVLSLWAMGTLILLFVVILKVKMDGSSDPDQYIAIRIDC